MIHTVRFAAAVLAGLTLTACQGNSGTPSKISGSSTTTSPHSTGTGGTTPSGSASPKSIQLLTTRAAQTGVEGRDYTTLYTVDPHGKSGARVGVLAIRDDGSAVIENVPLAGPGEFLTQSQIGIQKGQSRTWFAPQTSSQPRQAIQVAAHGQSIVWLETKSTDLYYLDWKVYAGLVGRPKPILLADSFALLKTDEIPYPPGVKTLTTDGVHAWWTMAYPTKKSLRGWDARIMVRDLAGREPLTVAVDKAKLPAATAGGVAYVRSNDVDSTVLANRYEIRLRRAGTDTLITSGPLAKEEQISTMCASDTLLAWTVRSPSPPRENPDAWVGGRLHVMTLATKAQQTIKLDDPAGSLSLGCGATFVAWGNGSGNGDPGQYVLDVPSGKIWKLGSLRGISVVRAAGTILTWTLPPKSAQEAAPWRVTKWHGQ